MSNPLVQQLNFLVDEQRLDILRARFGNEKTTKVLAEKSLKAIGK